MAPRAVGVPWRAHGTIHPRELHSDPKKVKCHLLPTRSHIPIPLCFPPPSSGWRETQDTWHPGDASLHPCIPPVATVTGGPVRVAGWEGAADRTCGAGAVKENFFLFFGREERPPKPLLPGSPAKPTRCRRLGNLHGADKMTRCKYARLLGSNFYGSSALCTFLLQRG